MTNRHPWAMLEAELQESVRKMCKDLGLYHYHPRTSIGSAAGWPDSVIIGRTIIYREMKSEYGKPTPEQTAVGYKLQAAGANWKIWRPVDLATGRIAAELTEVAGIQAKLFTA